MMPVPMFPPSSRFNDVGSGSIGSNCFPVCIHTEVLGSQLRQWPSMMSLVEVNLLLRFVGTIGLTKLVRYGQSGES